MIRSQGGDMLEQEGVHSAQKDYTVALNDDMVPPSHSLMEKSRSHEIISRVSRKIIDTPNLSHSLPLIFRTRKPSSDQLFESTLDPQILREKIQHSATEKPRNTEGQTLNIFKWIKKKKKRQKPVTSSDKEEYLDHSSSNSSFSDISIENEQEISEQEIPKEFQDNMLLIRSLVDHVSHLLEESTRIRWIQYLQAICIEHQQSAGNILGKTIYLLDAIPEEFCRQLTAFGPKHHLAWISEAYGNRMNLIKKQVTQLCQAHEITGIQPSNLVHQTKLPFAVAQTLVTSEGHINYALCRSLARHLLPPVSEQLSFHRDIHRVLNLISHSSKIRELLSAIEKPACKYSLANHLIRVQMGVNYSDPIYKRDAIVTALTACLSHLRQGPTGSCFATHFAIVLLSSHIEQCIRDFQMLLKMSKLTRMVGSVQKDFPFLLMMSSPSSGEELTFTHEGQLVTEKSNASYLWDSPGIQSACQSIKIDNPQEAITSVIEEYLSKQSTLPEHFKINVQSILSLLCDHQIKKHRLLPSKKMKLYSLAHFAYASQARNGLLSVWENSIAEMAEGKEGSMIMPPLLHSIQTPIINMITKELSVESLPQMVKDKITLQLSQELQRRIHLHYDPDIFNDSIDNEHMSSEGGYVIYDTMHEIYPNLWHRVDTPETYSKFIAEIFIDVTPKISEILRINFPKGNHEEKLNKLIKQIDSIDFAYQSMITYYPAYKSKKDLLTHWNKCKYTPWRTLSGNLAEKVREVYMEDDGQVERSVLKPKDAFELILNLLTEVKKMPDEEKRLYLKNPYKKIPVFTPTHAFSLLLGHPSLQQYADSNLSRSRWIKEQLFTPCHEVIDQPVDENFRKHVISYTVNQLVSSLKKGEFRVAVSLLPTDLNYPKFRSCLIQLLEIIDNNHSTREGRVQLLDTEICSTLPPAIAKIISGSAIHFADTNWNEGLHDIHLCVTLNPCSGKLAIMQTHDNGNVVKPVKQYWLLNHNWDFISKPEVALPNNDK